jgi:mevalonyl-CoA ligase
MNLTPSDAVCCPPPLFHCFGLVMGFLASFTHGSTIVFPCDQFDANEVLDALYEEKCTALLGVPTMFIAEIEANRSRRLKISSVRVGMAAGSSVSPSLVRQLQDEFGIEGVLIAYGMTETSPVTFITSMGDSEDKRANTVGRVLPHTAAKVVDREGNILPRGSRGEMCTSGYALQKGYYENIAKTEEAMKRDENGVLWMHTGDECVIDEEGYASVTGRIKDMIIRGNARNSRVSLKRYQLTF